MTASAVNLDAGTRSTIECDYLVGCDGASSFVRKSIGSEFVGIPVLQYAQSFYVRAPQLRSLLPGKPVWAYFSLNARRCGMTWPRRAGDLEHTELLLSWRNRAGSP